MSLSSLARQVKTLLAGKSAIHDLSMPLTGNAPDEKDRKNPTPFQIAWDLLRERREAMGLINSGETRRCLRAKLKAAMRGRP